MPHCPHPAVGNATLPTTRAEPIRLASPRDPATPAPPTPPAPESCGWGDFLATSRLRASRGDPCGRPGQAKKRQAECAWPAGERKACRHPALSPPPAGHRPNNHLAALKSRRPRRPGSRVGEGNFPHPLGCALERRPPSAGPVSRVTCWRQDVRCAGVWPLTAQPFAFWDATFGVVGASAGPVPAHEHRPGEYLAGGFLDAQNQAQAVDPRISPRPVGDGEPS
jgi:hypothetical protein